MRSRLYPVLAAVTAIIVLTLSLKLAPLGGHHQSNASGSQHGTEHANGDRTSTAALVGYVVLIDGGSSGTRVHVHQYIIRDTDPLPVIAPSLSMKVKPGLAAFSSVSAAAESLAPLIEFAAQSVPSELHAGTPIYLFATAGLRTIPIAKAEAILRECRALLAHSPFLFDPHRVRIISGVQEGLNGWIAANYLLGNFATTTAALPSTSSPALTTVGVLEMGGASFQLTYAPKHHKQFPNHSLIAISVAGRRYDIYTVSYLNYGLEKAQELYLQLHHELIRQSDPCYPSGITGAMHAGRIARGDYGECVKLVDQIIYYDINQRAREERREHPQAVQSQDEEWEHPHQPPLPSSSTPSDSSTDADTAHHEPGHQIDCSLHPCAFDGSYIPLIDPIERFLAIENFFYTSEFFGLADRHSEAQSFAMAELKRAGTEFCRLTWSEIEAHYPDEPVSDLQKYCFSAAYLPRVLEIGLGLGNSPSEPSSAPNIRITRAVNGVTLDWALGAVLLEITNHLHAERFQRTAHWEDSNSREQQS